MEQTLKIKDNFPLREVRRGGESLGEIEERAIPSKIQRDQEDCTSEELYRVLTRTNIYKVLSICHSFI